MTDNLKKYRQKIDEIDAKIIELLKSRFKMSHEIGRAKSIGGGKICVPVREKEILENVLAKTKSSSLSRGIEKIYKEIFAASRNSQKVCDEKFHHPISIGIIGHGNFGELLAQTFAKFWGGAKIKIFEPTVKINNKKFFSLKDVAKQNLVFPCVPISVIPETLELLKPHLGSETTIIDICSVKIFPINSVKEILPNTKLISTHPMYGPDSTGNGTDFCGRKMAVWNISADEKIYKLYKKFWETLGVDTIEMTPEKHDQLAAFSQAYIHFVGKIGEKMGIKKTPVDTKSFYFLCNALTMMNSDSEELFRDMMTKNPYAKTMREQFQETLNDIEFSLQK